MGRKKKEGETYQLHKPELRIQGVSEKTKRKVENICKHVGTNLSALLRPKVEEWIASYPPHFTKPPIDE
jgi:hypothetical protein